MEKGPKRTAAVPTRTRTSPAMAMPLIFRMRRSFGDIETAALACDSGSDRFSMWRFPLCGKVARACLQLFDPAYKVSDVRRCGLGFRHHQIVRILRALWPSQRDQRTVAEFLLNEERR